MKHARLFFLPMLAAVCLLWGVTASAQLRRLPGAGNSRFTNPFQVRFERAWEVILPVNAKLMEVGPLVNAKTSSLLLLVTGKDRTDPTRQLLVTHWDGLQFSTDASLNLTAVPLDALLLGHFRGALDAQKPEKGVRAAFVPPQVVTGEGIYEWTGKTLQRLFAMPADLKLEIIRDKMPAQLLVGAGNTSVAYEVGEKDAHLFAGDPPSEGGGYVRFGVGNQDFPGSESMVLGSSIRYAQSYWDDQNRWMIGLARGKSAGILELPGATIGDRIVVYVPKLASRDKSFWATLPEELEATWQGEPLPGRVLDVRVGDPKNEGRLGILVLLAENKDTERHLIFYRPVQQGTGGGQ